MQARLGGLPLLEGSWDPNVMLSRYCLQIEPVAAAIRLLVASIGELLLNSGVYHQPVQMLRNLI